MRGHSRRHVGASSETVRTSRRNLLLLSVYVNLEVRIGTASSPAPIRGHADRQRRASPSRSPPTTTGDTFDDDRRDRTPSSALLPPLLGTLERITWVQRHLFPPMADRLASELRPRAAALDGPLRVLEAIEWPADLRFMRDRLVDVTRRTLALVEAFGDAARTPEDPIGLYRALRRFAPLQEALYPLAPVLDPVSRWFLDPAWRDDEALVARLRAAALRDDDVRVGVLHSKNERDARGGFSSTCRRRGTRGRRRP